MCSSHHIAAGICNAWISCFAEESNVFSFKSRRQKGVHICAFGMLIEKCKRNIIKVFFIANSAQKSACAAHFFDNKMVEVMYNTIDQRRYDTFRQSTERIGKKIKFSG